jgi:hypothetical protein
MPILFVMTHLPALPAPEALFMLLTELDNPLIASLLTDGLEALI